MARPSGTALVVGSWNVQRLAAPDHPQADTRAKQQRVYNTLVRWLTASDLLSPDLLFLCEVTQTGEQAGGQLLDRMEGVEQRGSGRDEFYRARFFPVLDRRDEISPCSYLFIWNANHPRLAPLGDNVVHEGDQLEGHNRPFLYVEIPQSATTIPLLAAFSHEPSGNRGDPVLATCDHLAQGISTVGMRARQPYGAFLLGGLNCPLARLNPTLDPRLTRRNWCIGPPTADFTCFKEWYWHALTIPHYTCSLLDYMVYYGALPPPPPLQNTPHFSDESYALIDHRPVSYRVVLWTGNIPP